MHGRSCPQCLSRLFADIHQGVMFSLLGFHVFPFVSGDTPRFHRMQIAQGRLQPVTSNLHQPLALKLCVSAPHGGLGHRQYDTRHAVVDATCPTSVNVVVLRGDLSNLHNCALGLTSQVHRGYLAMLFPRGDPNITRNSLPLRQPSLTNY